MSPPIIGDPPVKEEKKDEKKKKKKKKSKLSIKRSFIVLEKKKGAKKEDLGEEIKGVSISTSPEEKKDGVKTAALKIERKLDNSAFRKLGSWAEGPYKQT